MAYQNLSFMFLHAGADVGGSGLTSSNENADYPRENAIDRRPSSLFKFNTSAADHWLKMNYGSAIAETVDRLIIPAGHNLDGAALSLQRAGSDSWPGTVAEAWTQSGSGIISRDLDSGGTDQYWRLSTTSTGQWEIPQWYLTRTRTLTGDGHDPSWTEEQRAVSIIRELDNRSASSVLGSDRWFYQFDHGGLSGTDLGILDDLHTAVGDAVAFYVDPPDDGEDPKFVKIVPGSWSRTQDHPVPKSGATYRIRFSLLEQTE